MSKDIDLKGARARKGEVVIIGAGRSGRGLHGELCFRDGWGITFADIDEGLVEALRDQGSYLSFSENEAADGFDACRVSGYRAFHIHRDRDGYLNALAEADIIFTATFDDAFPSIVQDVKDAIEVRIARGSERQFALVVGANYVDLHDWFDRALKTELTERERAFFDRHGVLAESIIYRVSSFPTPEQRAIDPLSVQSDHFNVLQVNTAQFARADEIEKPGFFQDEDDTQRFMHCKIWDINTSHCSLAYLGQYHGYGYVSDAACNDEISRAAYYASAEAYRGLARRYGLPDERNQEAQRELWAWYRDLTIRDTVERVGNDPLRKLRKNDRFIGAALNCLDHGILPVHICQNAAYGFFFHNEGDARTDAFRAMLGQRGIEATVQQVCGLDMSVPNEKLVYDLIVSKYYDLVHEDPVTALIG